MQKKTHCAIGTRARPIEMRSHIAFATPLSLSLTNGWALISIGTGTGCIATSQMVGVTFPSLSLATFHWCFYALGGQALVSTGVAVEEKGAPNHWEPKRRSPGSHSD